MTILCSTCRTANEYRAMLACVAQCWPVLGHLSTARSCCRSRTRPGAREHGRKFGVLGFLAWEWTRMNMNLTSKHGTSIHGTAMDESMIRAIMCWLLNYMVTSDQKSALPPVTDEIRAWYKALASLGGKAGSRTAKSISAQRTAKRRWVLRKLRYPPNGLKPYKQPGWYTKRYGPPIPPEEPTETLPAADSPLPPQPHGRDRLSVAGEQSNQTEGKQPC